MLIRPPGSAAVLGLLALGCGGDKAPPPADDQRGRQGPPAPPRLDPAPTLTGAGATFPNPIYTKWFDAYAKQTGVRINYQSIGSGGGIRQFTEGTVDFGATDGPMTDEQIKAVNGNVLHVPTVMGAVVLTYNLAGAGRRQAQARRHRRWPTSSWAGSPSGTTGGSPRSIPGPSCRTRTSSWSTARTAPAPPSSSPTS